MLEVFKTDNKVGFAFSVKILYTDFLIAIFALCLLIFQSTFLQRFLLHIDLRRVRGHQHFHIGDFNALLQLFTTRTFI